MNTVDYARTKLDRRLLRSLLSVAICFTGIAQRALADSPPATQPADSPAPLGVAVDKAKTVTEVNSLQIATSSVQIAKNIIDSIGKLPALTSGAPNYDGVDENTGKHFGDGAMKDFGWDNNTIILHQDTRGTYCRGFTLEQFLLAMPSLKPEDRARPTSDELQRLKDAWFGNDNTLSEIQRSELAVAALKNLADARPSLLQGDVIQLDAQNLRNVTPGDIMVLRRGDETEHCAIFLNWLIDSTDRNHPIVGLIYFSSQASSTGCDVIPADWTPGGQPVKDLLPPSQNTLGSGYGQRADFFDNVTYQFKNPDGTATAVPGQFIAAKSYCFHFSPPQ